MIEAIEKALQSNRKQLGLSGSDVSSHEDELENSLGKLIELDQLSICKTNLSQLPVSIGNLTKLTNLSCRDNKLSSIPTSISSLCNLKNLDLSNNCLVELPAELGNLSALTAINISCNKLIKLPFFENCSNLANLDAASNEITEFPTPNPQLALLCHLNLSSNKISNIPANICEFPSLKILAIEDNLIAEVPGNVLDCKKLKVFKLGGNELKDRRFRKLVDNDRTKPEQIVKYIKQHCPKLPTNLLQESKLNQQKDLTQYASKKPTIVILPPEDDLRVILTSEALKLRPYFVSCIVRSMNLQEDRFRKFLTRQNKLHDGVCNRRLHATIATHDLSKIKYKPQGESNKEGLEFCIQHKDELSFTPLNSRCKPVTIQVFVDRVKQEAELQRKQIKVHTVSSLYKYLDLVEGWTHFPCLMDAAGEVLSVPPLTNGDVSKISAATTDVLLEVSSGSSLQHCKTAMTELVAACLDVSVDHSLTVQQVRVIDDGGGLRCLFPASDDLHLNNVTVQRPGKAT